MHRTDMQGVPGPVPTVVGTAPNPWVINDVRHHSGLDGGSICLYPTDHDAAQRFDAVVVALARFRGRASVRLSR